MGAAARVGRTAGGCLMACASCSDNAAHRLTDVETGSAWLMCTACAAAYLSLPQVTQVP